METDVQRIMNGLPDPGGDDRATADPPRVIVVNKLPAGEVVRAGLVLMGLGLGFYVLWSLHKVVFLLFLAILLATAIEPLVNRLRRGPFSRGSGVLVVYTAIILGIGVPVMLTAPGLASQAGTFVESLPSRLEGLRPRADGLQPRPLRDVAVGVIDRFHARVQEPTVAQEPGNLVEIGAFAAETLLEFLTVFVLAFYWLVERAHIKRALLRIVPSRRAKDVNTVWMEVEGKLGGWVRGQLMIMLIMGVVAGTGYFFIGLPSPFLLGVIAGICEIIPLIGAWLAFTPAVLVAFFIEPYLALIVIGFAVVVQQIEGNILVPRILGHTVGVSPLTVLLGILVGAFLYGLPGAFVAVPTAAAIQVILAHMLRMEDPVQTEAHSPAVNREAAQEATAGQAPNTAVAQEVTGV